jgi:hypothetical protein
MKIMRVENKYFQSLLSSSLLSKCEAEEEKKGIK